MIVSALACAMAWAANASINYNIRGTEYVADTIFHAMVGPSTSCTQLLMRSDAGRQMYVRYSITDLTNPYVTFSAVMGQDKYAGGETISGMSCRKSRPGAQYFLGVNGDFSEPVVSLAVANRWWALQSAPVLPTARFTTV